MYFVEREGKYYYPSTHYHVLKQDDTLSDHFGPFDTLKEAEEHLQGYCKWLKFYIEQSMKTIKKLRDFNGKSRI